MFRAEGFCPMPLDLTVWLRPDELGEEAMKTKHTLRKLDDNALGGLIDRLRRNELDFEERLAARLQAVADPGMPASDPLYQRLRFTLKGLGVQRAEAERELAQRAGPS